MNRRDLLQKLLAGSTALAFSCKSIDDEEVTNTPLNLNLRSLTSAKDGLLQHQVNKVKWVPSETAIIICDMWDNHWCKGAAARVAEMAPRLNEVINYGRSKGITIIHSPSETVDYYKGRRAYINAQSAPFIKPPILLSTKERWGTNWCWPDKTRESDMPIDDSDMGCNCPTKCTIKSAWSSQINSIDINDFDYITDNGQVTYNILAQKRIKNIILCGVHLNMCVLGRPFGIRQMVSLNNMNVALMRDFTDTMYNSRMKPMVDHFTGTDLVVQHVERYWCPSFLSTDLTGKAIFSFKEDLR